MQGRRDIQKHLSELLSFSRRLEDDATRIISKLELTDYSVLERFKPYVLLKKKIEELKAFYDTYKAAVRETENIQIGLSRTELGDLVAERTYSLSTLSQVNLIEKVNTLCTLEENLGKYAKVNIVKEFISKNKRYIDKLLMISEASFYEALKRLPKVPENAPEYAQFLLKRRDEKEFLSAYTKVAYDRLRLYSGKADKKLVLKQFKNLGNYLDLVSKINTQILGPEKAHNINVGLISLIVINIREAINDILLKIDADNNPAEITFLVDLRGILGSKKLRNIKEVSELRKYNPQIDKLILNCFIQFFGNIERVNDPNVDLKAESFCKVMNKALQKFSLSKRFKDEWVSSYGPSFGVYTSDKLESNFSEKCLLKVEKLSRKLEQVRKNVYLINNYYQLKDHADICGGKTISELIDKNTRLIIGLWRIKFDRAKSLSELKEILEDELPTHCKYSLPASQGHEIRKRLKEMIETLIAQHEWDGLPIQIIDTMNLLYKGD